MKNLLFLLLVCSCFMFSCKQEESMDEIKVVKNPTSSLIDEISIRCEDDYPIVGPCGNTITVSFVIYFDEFPTCPVTVSAKARFCSGKWNYTDFSHTFNLSYPQCQDLVTRLNGKDPNYQGAVWEQWYMKYTKERMTKLINKHLSNFTSIPSFVQVEQVLLSPCFKSCDGTGAVEYCGYGCCRKTYNWDKNKKTIYEISSTPLGTCVPSRFGCDSSSRNGDCAIDCTK